MIGVTFLIAFFCIPIWAISASISLIFTMVFVPEIGQQKESGIDGYFFIEMFLIALVYYFLYARFIAKNFAKFLNGIGFLVNYQLSIKRLCKVCGKTIGEKKFPTNVEPV